MENGLKVNIGEDSQASYGNGNGNGYGDGYGYGNGNGYGNGLGTIEKSRGRK